MLSYHCISNGYSSREPVRMTHTIPQRLITTGEQVFVQFKEAEYYYSSIGLTQHLNKQNWAGNSLYSTTAVKIHLENPTLKDH